MKRMGISIFLIVVMAVNLILPVDASDGLGTSEIGKERLELLFIGNSLTYYRAKGKNNYFLNYFEKMAKCGGHKVFIRRVAKSGQRLSNWADEDSKEGRKAYQAIASRDWDYVILQENTDYAAADNKSFQKAARKLCRAIRRNCSETEVVYNCTWAYQKGKTIGGKYYSYTKMQKLLNQHYSQAARATKGRVSWAGTSFFLCKKQTKSIELYVSDNNHPSKYGSYLSACSMYAAIFRESPPECNIGFVGTKKKVRKLQNIAAKTNHIQ